jgi:hypothetical protein
MTAGGRMRAVALGLASAALIACTTAPIPSTYTQDELKARCDRQRGWWRPDELMGGFCDFRGP